MNVCATVCRVSGVYVTDDTPSASEMLPLRRRLVSGVLWRPSF